MGKENPGFDRDRESWIGRNEDKIFSSALMVSGVSAMISSGILFASGMAINGAAESGLPPIVNTKLMKVLVWVALGGEGVAALSALVAFSSHLIIGVQEKISKQTRKQE